MIVLTAVSGNVMDGYEPGDPEILMLARHELGKGRVRRTTDRGTDVALDTDPQSPLRHGDVLAGGGISVMVQQAPESVVHITQNGPDAGDLILAGHMIGNMHRPISTGNGFLSFPAQDGSEVETFRKIFHGMRVTVSAHSERFVPRSRSYSHGH